VRFHYLYNKATNISALNPYDRLIDYWILVDAKVLGVGQTAVDSPFCICLGKSRKTPIAGIASLNPVGSNKPAQSIQSTHFDKVQGKKKSLRWSVFCCQVSATDRSLVQSSPTDCGVSERKPPT
jgi:hypothetical protein